MKETPDPPVQQSWAKRYDVERWQSAGMWPCDPAPRRSTRKSISWCASRQIQHGRV